MGVKSVGSQLGEGVWLKLPQIPDVYYTCGLPPAKIATRYLAIFERGEQALPNSPVVWIFRISSIVWTWFGASGEKWDAVRKTRRVGNPEFVNR